MTDIKKTVDELIQKAGAVPPVDRTKRETTGGMDPDSPEHKELKANGQQKDYVVLTVEERKRGFVRPVRGTYTHIVCGTVTAMPLPIAETYARDPGFYTGTFCVACSKHFNLVLRTDDGNTIRQFKWDDGTGVGE